MARSSCRAPYKLKTHRAAPSGARRPVTVDELAILARALDATVGELLLSDSCRAGTCKDSLMLQFTRNPHAFRALPAGWLPRMVAHDHRATMRTV
jgi:hypothetical protein